ncbi:hypothetical protein Micbo1qcDRAFT_169692, partial [Microdochium bolleyi]
MYRTRVERAFENIHFPQDAWIYVTSIRAQVDADIITWAVRPETGDVQARDLDVKLKSSRSEEMTSKRGRSGTIQQSIPKRTKVLSLE